MAMALLNITNATLDDNDSVNVLTTHSPTDDKWIKKPQAFSLTQIQYYYSLRYIYALKSIILAGGVPSNVLTIRAFLKMGLKDCVTIVFFSLAISDLCYLAMEVVKVAINFVLADSQYIALRDNVPRYLYAIFGVNLAGIDGMVGDFSVIFFSISSYLVAFLAIQRSLCVLRPLQFKHMFTRGLTWIIVSTICVYWIICQMLEWAFYRFNEVPRDGYPNATIIRLQFHRSILKQCTSHYFRVMNYIFLPSTCVIIVLGGLFIMAHALMKSIRFRQGTSLTVAKDWSGLDKDKSGASDHKSDSSEKGTAVRSSKERQAIVQVAILSAFFLLAKLPDSIRVIIKYTMRVASSKHYYVFKLYLQTYAATLETLNGSINFIVYYKYNRKFRELSFHC